MAVILHLHTGGTISMVPGPDGLEPENGLVERHMDALLPPDMTIIRHVMTPLIDSSDAGPEDWNRMIDVIAAHHPDTVGDHLGVDGCIITHGTDSMAYAAAALVAALPGLVIPVIMTGSMKALSLPGSDGDGNLKTALQAVETAGPGVWLAFAGKVLPGSCLVKQDSTGFDAFLAAIADDVPCRPAPVFAPCRYGKSRSVILTVSPGLGAEIVQDILNHVDGMVLRVYGAGSVPNSVGIVDVLANAARQGKKIVAVSQCLKGGMNWTTYAASAGLRRAGVTDGGAMTAEMAQARLMLALSSNDPGDEYV